MRSAWLVRKVWSYQKNVEKLSQAEVRTLESGLRMRVVNQLLEATWPSRATMTTSSASEIPRAGYLVSEPTMVAASVLLSSAPGCALEVLG
jgi:hypothetical protein